MFKRLLPLGGPPAPRGLHTLVLIVVLLSIVLVSPPKPAVLGAGGGQQANALTFLPLILHRQRVPMDCAAIGSPFSIQIAALHEIVPGDAGTPEDRAQLQEEWLAFYEEAFPTLVEALAGTGACWTRVRIDWSLIEPVDGEPYSWGYHDPKLALIAGTGVQMIGTIEDVPEWARGEPHPDLSCTNIHPDHLNDFAEFLSDLVNRYKAPPYNIHHWELRNEPDGTTRDRDKVGQGCAGYDGDQYAQMLAVAYSTIKAADPVATVLMGGVAYDSFAEYGGPFYRYFPDEVMAAQGGDYLDATTFHYFHDFYAEWERWVPNGDPPTCGDVEDGEGQPYTAWGIDLIAKANHFRNRLSTCAGVDLPVWLTELAEHGIPGDDLSLAQQARYVVQGNVRGLAAGLENITWFALITPFYDTANQGLLYEDLSPKPAYYAYQTLAAQLTGWGYAATLSVLDVEGYRFHDAAGREQTVAWANGDPLQPAYLTFAGATQLRVVDRHGAQSMVMDGGPGDADGKSNGSIQIQLPGVPLDPDPNHPPRISAEPFFILR